MLRAVEMERAPLSPAVGVTVTKLEVGGEIVCRAAPGEVPASRSRSHPPGPRLATGRPLSRVGAQMIVRPGCSDPLHAAAPSSATRIRYRGGSEQGNPLSGLAAQSWVRDPAGLAWAGSRAPAPLPTRTPRPCLISYTSKGVRGTQVVSRGSP